MSLKAAVEVFKVAGARNIQIKFQLRLRILLSMLMQTDAGVSSDVAGAERKERDASEKGR